MVILRSSAPRAAFTSQHKGCPRERVGELRRVFGIQHRHYRASQRLRAPDRRIASQSAKVPVVSLTVASDHAGQCETKTERAPAEKNARTPPYLEGEEG